MNSLKLSQTHDESVKSARTGRAYACGGDPRRGDRQKTPKDSGIRFSGRPRMPSFEKRCSEKQRAPFPGPSASRIRTATSGKPGPAGVTAALQLDDAEIVDCRDPLHSHLTGSGNVMQCDRADPGGDVQTGIAFDAKRLQRDRPIRAADQHIGADPDADRSTG